MNNLQEKPDWFAAHEKSDLKHFGELATEVAAIKAMLTPVVETYETVATLGKWSKIALGVLLLLLSIAAAVKQLWPGK